MCPKVVSAMKALPTVFRNFSLAVIVLAIFSLLLLPVSAEETDQPVVDEQVIILSLDDCYATALENNIQLRQAKLGIEASLLDRIRSEAFFDPGFSLNLNTQHSESSGDSGSDSSNYNFGAQYRLPSINGGSWVFSLDQSRSTGSFMSGTDMTTSTDYTSQVGVAYSMPILEGYGERINRLGIQRSDIGIKRSETAINEVERGLNLGIVQSYTQAVLAKRQIEVSVLSLDNAQNLVEEVQARIDVGQFAPYELLAAQAGLAERQEAIINAETAYNVALDSLKEIIGLPITDAIDVDVGILNPVWFEVNADDLYLLAQDHRPDLEDLDLRLRQAELDLLLAQDQRQSSLSWNTVLGLAGASDDYTGSISDMDRFTWYTGLEYSVPLGGNRIAEADISSVELNIEQLELDRVDLLRALQRDIRSAVEDFNNALLRIDVTSQGLEVQEVKMENELARLELGLITSRDLLEFDLDLASARLSYDSALADAILALARLEYLVNQPLLRDALTLSGSGQGMETTQ